jgi:hypothetical protein
MMHAFFVIPSYMFNDDDLIRFIESMIEVNGESGEETLTNVAIQQMLEELNTRDSSTYTIFGRTVVKKAA